VGRALVSAPSSAAARYKRLELQSSLGPATIEREPRLPGRAAGAVAQSRQCRLPSTRASRPCGVVKRHAPRHERRVKRRHSGIP
jgi:hypothetical protein